MYMPRVERAHGLRLLPRSRGVDLVRRPGATAERADEILAALASHVTRPALRNADLVVVGAGALGLTAALRVAKAGLAVQVIEGGHDRGGRHGARIGPGRDRPQVRPQLPARPLRSGHGEASGELFRRGGRRSLHADPPRAARRPPFARRVGPARPFSQRPTRMLSARALECPDLGALASVLGDLDARRATGAHGYLGGRVDRRGGARLSRRPMCRSLPAPQNGGAPRSPSAALPCRSSARLGAGASRRRAGTRSTPVSS